MTSQIVNIRGTKDLFGDELAKLRFIEEKAREIAQKYMFFELYTPIIEFAEVFAQNLGESSDVVSKEMYLFQDRSGNNICLRPEFTAAVSRAFITHFQQYAHPIKLFSFGPLFRYERPQRGRQRQFHQVNLEWIGAQHPLWDVEVILLANEFLKSLGVKSRIEINCLGCEAARHNYREALVEYFKKHRESLSEDSVARLEKNPLRILDSKSPQDIELLRDVPSIFEYHSEDSKNRFDTIKKVLDQCAIRYEVNKCLVRGLDYYSELIFEYKSDEIGAQDTILGGGRYDSISENLGGKKIASIGFAAGVERLMSLMTNTLVERMYLINVVSVGDSVRKEAMKIAYNLRNNGFHVDINYDVTLKSAMRKAADGQLCIIIGEQELSAGECLFKLMETGEQFPVKLSDLLARVSKLSGMK